MQHLTSNILNLFLRFVDRVLLSLRFRKEKPFDYKTYWHERYVSGDTSGCGSYGVLAEYKAEFINEIMEKNQIKSAIEFGCGDGNQLGLIRYPEYLGLDVAPSAVEKCRSIYSKDPSKQFSLYDPAVFFKNDIKKADIVVCLDVLYHVIDEKEFCRTLDDIFSCAAKYVVLYTTLEEKPYEPGSHLKHRNMKSYLSRYSGFHIESFGDQRHKDLTTACFITLQKIGIAP